MTVLLKDDLMRVLFALLLCALAVPTFSEERTLTPEQLEALQNQGELGVGDDRPARRLPDLTKGELAGERMPNYEWHLGPTGIFGYMVGGFKGDQIEVTSVRQGSPAEGKLHWGDVILGVNGQKFQHGQNMGIVIGKAIIEAEREANGGILKLIVWRDKNFAARNGKKNIADKDIDELIDKAQGDNTLYDWVAEDKRADVVRSANFEEFPIDASVMEVTFKLAVLPDYSDSSPYDCPKAERIREDAWKVLETQLQSGKIKANRYGTIVPLALVASGKPEHRDMVKEWVRSPNAKSWHPTVEGTMDIMKPAGYMSWRMSYDALDAALYYEATGDEFVLPAVREYAIFTAMGQAHGGSWGHTFAWPAFNGGELHGMNPGYGALNAAGNRCYFLICLAKKLGIEHPEIELAVERGTKYFRSYYEKGAVPYGHFGAADSDDSNGKNTGVAFGLKMLGDTQGAKWFAQMSNHASFTRRGGHGDSYTWHWSPWAATMLGPKGTIASHRNLRWWFTLCRMHDGSFVIHPLGDGGPNLRSATATFALHYSAPLKQTLLTGKDVDEAMLWKDDEFDRLMASALPQLNNPELIKSVGTPWNQRGTDELFELLGIFKPKARRIFATELAKRYKAGEKEILPRFAELLKSDNPRLRGAACRGLEACGADATLQYMSGVAKLLNDPEEFVRMRAVATITKASQSTEVQTAVLKTTIEHRDTETLSPNSVPSVTQGALFTAETTLADHPFKAGLDDELVREALEKLITLDPSGNRGIMSSRMKVWDKDTAARLAGPLVHAAEQEQIVDQMFNGRRTWTLGYLEKIGPQEAIDASASYLRKYLDLPRPIRQKVTYKRGTVEAMEMMRHPAAAKPYLDGLYLWMLDKPLVDAFKATKEDPAIPLYVLINTLEAAGPAEPLPQLADDAAAHFNKTLTALASDEERLKICRSYLADPSGKDYFRKLNALAYVVQAKQADAINDVLPYLGHAQWRLREQAHDLAVALVNMHGGAALTTGFSAAEPNQAKAILAVLVETGSKDGRKLAEDAMSHESPVVRGAAAQAYIALGGEAVLPKLLETMRKETSMVALGGFESAALSLRDQPSAADLIRTKAIAWLPDSELPLRASLYWLLAQVGGEEAMNAIAAAISDDDNEDLDDYQAAVGALSYSPHAMADKLLLNTVRANIQNKRDRVAAKRVNLAASEGVRRMVIGEEGLGKRPIEEQLDYAEAVLKMTLNEGTIRYLGRIKTGRCAYILQDAMRRGAPATAAQSIISATDDLSNATKKDKQLGESALVDVIEFIEVTYIRGTAEDFVHKTKEEQMAYIAWKAISAQAGKNLLKLTQNKEPDPLPEFDDTDLDF